MSKVEDTLNVSLDFIRFFNPLQVNVGLYGDNLRGFLLVVIILIGIASFGYLKNYLLTFSFMDEKSSNIFSFLIIFMAIGSMPQNMTI